MIHLNEPVSNPPTPRNSRKLEQLDERSCNIRAVGIEEDKPLRWSRTDRKNELRAATEDLEIREENIHQTDDVI